jgi:hypothetical protein
VRFRASLSADGQYELCGIGDFLRFQLLKWVLDWLENCRQHFGSVSAQTKDPR